MASENINETSSKCLVNVRRAISTSFRGAIINLVGRDLARQVVLGDLRPSERRKPHPSRKFATLISLIGDPLLFIPVQLL